MNLRNHIVGAFLSIALLASCRQETKTPEENTTEAINPVLDYRPNIVWIVAEDMSSTIAAFGDSTIQTPTLDRLAEEGVCYDHFYTPAPVCAPARSAIITGMYPISIGTHNMRTGPWYAGIPPESRLKSYEQFVPEGIGAYEAVPAPEVKMFTEYLRKAGYYASNNAKEDYQFLKTPTAWDDCSNTAHWRKRKPGQPFFSVFNLFVTHESQIWQKATDSLRVDAELDVPVPPYLPNTKIARQDIRRMYSNIVEMDQQVKGILDQLAKDKLLDSTIVVWYTDHGGPLPRQKRSLHDSGIKVPMIIRYPNGQYATMRSDRMISFIDLAPTTLSLAGIKPPEYMQGKAFLGKYMSRKKEKYAFAAADRYDKFYDRSRAVRDKRYKYIRHYDPNRPVFSPIGYRENMPIMKELNRLREKDSLTEVQKIWFKPTKAPEELYDISTDPHEIHNLAADPEYQEKLKELRTVNDRFVKEVNDLGSVAEKDLVQRFWPDGIQPKTGSPKIEVDGNLAVINCDTEGATIGYRKGNEKAWHIYSDKVAMATGDTIEVVAHRLGYKPSEIITVTLSASGAHFIE